MENINFEEEAEKKMSEQQEELSKIKKEAKKVSNAFKKKINTMRSDVKRWNKIIAMLQGKNLKKKEAKTKDKTTTKE